MGKLNSGLFSSVTDEWATPKAFFQSLDAEFHFDLDPCANSSNAKCNDFYSIDDDGLTKDWGGAKSVLQSSLWESNIQMGKEMLRRIKEARHTCCYAYPCEDRYFVFPRLYLSQGKRNQIHPGSVAFQRF